MNENLSELTGRELKVLNCIHKNGPITKNDLIEKLNMKLSTLNRTMVTLENKKFIFESGISGSSGGRRPAEFDITHSGIYVIGVDISRTYAKAVIMNLKNQVLEKYRFEMDDSITPQKCVDKIVGTIEIMVSKLAIDKRSIMGIGIGTVGPMNRENGMLLHPKGFPNAAWDGDVPIRELLQKKTGLSCMIDNGANTAALLEYHFGAGRGSSCVAYIHCGVGLRSAIIRDGVIIRTMNDVEDAFAQMTIDISGRCLEDYVPLEAIRKRYRENAGKWISYNELICLAADNNKSAAEAFKYSAEILSMGISNMAKLLNPDLVILSGPLILRNETFYIDSLKAFRERNQNNTIVFSKEGAFKEDVVAVGAGLMIIEQYLKHKGRDE